MTRPLLIISFLLFAIEIFSQPDSRYHVRFYGTDNGMPSNGIKGLQWDESTGFLWMATEAGIVRFNGLEFKTYSRDNTPLIASERIVLMMRNHRGEIFTTDEAANVFKVRNNRLTFFRRINSNEQYHMLLISDTLLTNGLLDTILYDPSEIRMLTVSDTSFYTTGNDGLYYYSPGIKKKASVPLSTSYKLFKIGGQCFSMTDRREVYKLPDMNEHPEKDSAVEVKNLPAKLLNKTSHIYWAAGMQKPVLVDGNTAWLLSYEGGVINASLITDEVPTDVFFNYVQYSEKKKMLFIGTDSRGLLIISPKRVFPAENEEKGIRQRNAYYVQLELGNGSVLSGEGHIIGDDPLSEHDVPIRGKFERSIALDTDSVLWFIQNFGPGQQPVLHSYRYSSRKQTVYEKVEIPNSGSFLSTVGGILIANPTGIGRLTGDSIQYLYYFDRSTYTQLYSMIEMEPGVVALANCRGLLRFDTRSKTLDTIVQTGQTCVRSLMIYNGYLFFGTYGKGFFMYKNGRARAMPLDPNNYLLYTHCFQPDGLGYCWMSSNRGLFKASLAELIDAFERGTSDIYYHYLGRNDGMITTEMNGGCNPCALRLRNGHLSFPTMQGLLRVDPANTALMMPDGPVFIDEMWANNTRVRPDSLSNIVLPAATSELTIALATPAWSNKENLYLEYQLDNNRQWKPLRYDNNLVVSIPALSAGKHTLRIRKRNGYGRSNYSTADIRFSIARFWYREWWFYVLVAAALAVLFVLFARFRTQRLRVKQLRLEKQVAEKTKELQYKNEVLEKNDSIKTRLISIISHDIVTPLKFLTVAGKNLVEKRKLMTEDLQEETIREMATTSQELQLLSTNILNWIKYQNKNRLLAKERFNVADLVDQVFATLNSLARGKQLKLVNEASRDISIHQFYEPLKILLYNLISNAINFSEKGSIVVAVQAEAEGIIVEVIDEGIGMTEEQVDNILSDQMIISSSNIDGKKGNGLGYLIIKDLLNMIGATLQIRSEKGMGTVVSVTVQG